YGYIKNHKKTIKNGQARTRESEEYKKKPRIQNRSQKSQTRSQVQSQWSNKVNNKRTNPQNVSPWVKSVNHEAITSLLSSTNHVSNGESTRGVGFCAKLTHKTSTNVTSKNDMLAILRCPQFDQTATIEAQMIEEMIG
ncbi:hypothetical protein Tco_1518082, partial [Tanacetum coccineum]